MTALQVTAIVVPAEGTKALFGGLVVQAPTGKPINTRTAHRIEVLFWSKLTLAAKDGVQASHCEGPHCDPSKATCDCPCMACDRRRTMYEMAGIEILGPQTDAEIEAATKAQDPELVARVERRWREKIAAAQEAGANARHCHGALCMPDDGDEGIAVCTCSCKGCSLILALLLEAQREILGSASDS